MSAGKHSRHERAPHQDTAAALALDRGALSSVARCCDAGDREGGVSGSEAEERIRGKAEALLRVAFPDARIIHELVLQQGGVRIDLAAVTPNRLICVEIKSERDVLTRLPDQVRAMKRVADLWRVCVADAHVDKAREIAGWTATIAERELDAPGYRMGDLARDAMYGLCNAPARLEMLWADELRRICCPSRNAPRRSCIAAASDSMTGADVRRVVCATLRARPFPRADEAIPWTDQQERRAA